MYFLSFSARGNNLIGNKKTFSCVNNCYSIFNMIVRKFYATIFIHKDKLANFFFNNIYLYIPPMKEASVVSDWFQGRKARKPRHGRGQHHFLPSSNFQISFSFLQNVWFVAFPGLKARNQILITHEKEILLNLNQIRLSA